MAEYRLFGKEIAIRITLANTLLREITAIRNFTFETRQRIITEGYLGETAQRQDEIFDEVGGSFTVVPEGTEILDLQDAIAQRAQQRVANQQVVSVTFRISFPNGSIQRVTIPDMKFDPIPFNVTGRDAYVDMNLVYKATSYMRSAA